VVDDGRVGDGADATAFIGQTTAPAQAAIAADSAGAAARSAAGAALCRVPDDGAVADAHGAEQGDDAAAIAPAAEAAVAATAATAPPRTPRALVSRRTRVGPAGRGH